MKKISIVSIIASGLLATTPNISDIQKEIKPPLLPQKSVELPKVQVELKEPLKSFDSAKEHIRGYKISGNVHINSAKLQELIKDYNNKDLTFDKVQEVTTKITKYYRNNGYFVARAYIPKQEMKDGILEITIIEGNYGKFVLDNKSLVKTDIVQSMLDDVKKYNIVSTNTLERAMLIINDQSGVVVSNAEVMPGEAVGTSDFAISTSPTNRVNGYAMLDNYGSAYTGRYRLNGGVYINSPLSLGDKLTLSGLATKNKGLSNMRVAYELPIMPNGLKLNTSISNTTYKLGDTYSSLDAIGSSKAYDIGLSYPFIRTATQNLNIYSSLAYKELKDEIRSTSTTTPKTLKSIKAGVSYDKVFSNSNIAIDTYLTGGNLSIDEISAKAIDTASANTDGTYSKINLDVVYNLSLNPNLLMVNKLSLQSTLKKKNLDGSEDMTISGSNGVKAYLDSELSGEKGYLYGAQLLYSLPQKYGQIGLFYDLGAAFMANTKNVAYNNRTLQDTGIGYYNIYKNINYQFQYARAIGNTVASSETDRNSRLLFSSSISF